MIAHSKFLWPGYGDNSRVLAWIFDRCDGTAPAVETAIGRVPTPGALDLDGLGLTSSRVEQLLEVNHDAWRAELELIDQHFATFGPKLPVELRTELDLLAKRLTAR